MMKEANEIKSLDEIEKQLIALFHAELSANFQQIQLALECEDYTKIEKIAHTLAGTAGYCHQGGLQKLALVLMKTCRIRHYETILDIVSALGEEVRRFNETYAATS